MLRPAHLSIDAQVYSIQTRAIAPSKRAARSARCSRSDSGRRTRGFSGGRAKFSRGSRIAIGVTLPTLVLGQLPLRHLARCLLCLGDKGFHSFRIRAIAFPRAVMKIWLPLRSREGAKVFFIALIWEESRHGCVMKRCLRAVRRSNAAATVRKPSAGNFPLPHAPHYPYIGRIDTWVVPCACLARQSRDSQVRHNTLPTDRTRSLDQSIGSEPLKTALRQKRIPDGLLPLASLRPGGSGY